MQTLGAEAGLSEYTAEEKVAVQRRTVKTLLASQATGGVGLVATYIVTALLAKDITGSKAWATVAAGCLSIGAALVSFPMARLMRSKGRRVGLRTGYLVGATGAGLALLAAITRSYPLLCIGVLGAGAGNAANLATRYAASDLAPEATRARTISFIVWATTLGSGTGSLVSGSASSIGESIGLPSKAGSYLLSGLMFLVAATIVETRLRPDPLAVAGGLGKLDESGKQEKLSAGESLRLILANPAARLAVGAMIVSQVTMVGVMALTPLHMDEGGQTQNLIGLMMTFHILGMYLFSPVVGSLTDRIGQYPMLYIAGALCTAGAGWAALTPADGRVGVFMGNFLIGLGWCFGVVAASSLIVSEFPIHQRVGVQGVGDLAMIGSGAFAGVFSGVLYTGLGYSGVNTGNAAFGAMLILGTAVTYLLVKRQSNMEPAITTG
ncbi:MAG: MFS transporter [Acidimicrobiia bacterium]|nr:MFS transporter [Acidimicrobiia bacterium]